MSKIWIDKIVDNLDTVFRGDAWHGPSVMEMLKSVPTSKVAQKQQFSEQTIAQHVYHLFAWREFVIEKLNENIHFSLATDEQNWGTVEKTQEENYLELVRSLKDIHVSLLEKLEKFDDTLLDKTVPGEEYTFYTLLNGLIQHDTYHLGMIWVLWQ
ncbi:MAG: DinB family protein [Leadbetterella sp.]